MILDYIYQHVLLYVIVTMLTSITFFLIYNKYYEKLNVAIPLFEYTDQKLNNSYLYIFLLIGVMIFIWIVFFPLNFGHRDEITLLTNGTISPTIYNGRFFPLGHMEFNILTWSFAKESLFPLYLFSFIEIFIFIIIIDKIVNTNNFIIRAYIFITSYLYYIVSVSNLVIPERNAILLVLLGIYFYREFSVKNNKYSGILSLLFFSMALYYKEPIFALLFIFIFVFSISNFIELNKKNKKINILNRITPINISILLSIIFFIMGYLFYTYYNGAPSSIYYGPSTTNIQNIIDNFIYYLITIPILLILLLSLILVLFSYVLFNNNSFDKTLSIALACGAIVYSCELIILGLPLNGYYWSLPLILMSLSFALILKNITFKNLLEKKYLLVATCFLTIGCFFVTSKAFISISNDVKIKKMYQNEYSFLEKTLKNKDNIASLYYVKEGNYGKYATAILMIFIHKMNIDSEFTIYSDTGCASWNENYNNGTIHCVKKEYDEHDNYDVIVVENGLKVISSMKYTIYQHEPKYEVNNFPKLTHVGISNEK